MIKSVTVTNYLGESLKMELTNPYDSGIAITDITGIGPRKADINVTELTSSDGSLYNSARLGTRNIVMTLRFMIAPDIETVRQKSYKYFPIKKELILTFETDNRSCYIAGYVESNEPVIFDENEYTQISIICPDPYFYSTEANAMVFSGVVPMFEFEFSNETENGSNEERNIIMSEIEVAQEQTVYYNGDSEIGVTIQIHAIGTVENVTIYNTGTREFIKIDTEKLKSITGSTIVAGDFRILEDSGELLNRLTHTEVAEKLVGMGRYLVGIAAAGDQNGFILQRDRVNTASGNLLQQLKESQQRRVFRLQPAQSLADRRFRRIDELSDASQLSAARHTEILPEPEINTIGRKRRIAAHVHFRINQIAVERPGPHRQQLVHADNRLRERLIGSSRFNLLRTGKGNIKSGNHGFKKTSVQVSTENERNLSLVYG